MALHLNYDGKQNNGVIFNATYQGCMYQGAEYRPGLSFDYESFMYSEVFTGQPNYVIQSDGIKRLMTAEEATEVVAMAKEWVQPLGQEGNPTPEQQLEIDIRVLKQKREQALSELTHTFEDGSVIQVRPSDIPVFQLAISVGQDEDWVMANDTVRTVTVEEMQQAMNSGIVQAKAVWNDYTAKLKLLVG